MMLLQCFNSTLLDVEKFTNLYATLLILVPDGPPENIKAQAFSSSTVEVSWNPPKRPNGKIIAYQIYIRLEKEEQPLRLKIHGITSINKISYNISDLS